MKYKLKPWAHQEKVINHCLPSTMFCYALFHDMGTGKTKSTIEIYRAKCGNNERLLKALVICPLVVMDNWQREFLAHSYVPKSKIQVVDGTTKADGSKLKNPSLALKKKQLSNPNAEVFITNTDSIGNKNIFPILCSMGFEFLAVDESHKFKSYQAVRTKNLHTLSVQSQLRYKFILTGSPVLQSALDLWAQFYVLDPKILGANFFSFRAEYFYDKNADMPPHIHFANWIPKDKAYYKKLGLAYKDPAELLNKIIFKHGDRVMKRDVLDLPPRTVTKVDVPFHKDQERIYNEMKTELVAFLEDPFSKTDLKDLLEQPKINIEDLPESMKANLAIVKMLRLQMIVNGIFVSDEGEITDLPCNKYKQLEEDLTVILNDDPTNKIIIWACFTAMYPRIEEVIKKLNVKYTRITGLETYEQKISNMDEFNGGQARIILANQGAGGTGINLIAANYELYLARNFNLEHDLQSDARSDRGGQTRNTNRRDYCINNTIDEETLVALQRKKELAEDILAKRDEFTSKEIIGLLN